MEILHNTSPFIYAIAWALVHSLWQGLLLVLLLKAILRFIPAYYSAVRYNIAVASLAVMVSWFLLTCYYQYSYALILYSAPAPHSFHPGITGYSHGQSLLNNLSAWYNANSGMVVAIYILGISILLSRLVYNLYSIRKLKTAGENCKNENINMMLGKCRQTLHITKQVVLRCSDRVMVPMVMGTVKPVILLPFALLNHLSPAEMEAILLHELAHVKRNDFLVNIVQMFMETFLFYNPFAWAVSAIIRQEREHCCDDIVINKAPDRLPYAKALARIESFRSQVLIPAMAATGHKNDLLNRIKRIMEMKKNNINFAQLTATLVLAVLFLASVTFILPEVKAQSKKEKDKKKTEQPAKEEKVIEKRIVDKKEDATGADTVNRNRKKTIVITRDEDGDSVIKHIEIMDAEDASEIAEMALEMAEKVIKDVDITRLIDSSLTVVNWKELERSMHDSIDAVDWSFTRREVETSLAESRKEIEEARKELTKAQNELAVARRNYAAARSRSKPVVVITSSYDNLLNKMEKDGLIDRSRAYKIEKTGDDLYIDGRKQSKAVTEKYLPKIKADKLIIKGNSRSIKISSTD